MAGAKRRNYKKKGVSRRRKSGHTKRKSTKKTYRKRRSTKRKSTKRKYKRRSSKGPSLGEMAFVVANYHPAPEAAANAQAVQQAVQAAQAVQVSHPVAVVSDSQSQGVTRVRSRDENEMIFG